MPSQRNVHGLAEIKHHLATAKAVILANYAGLSVADQTTLRAKLSAAGGEFLVAKNNLLKIALKEKLGDLPRELEDVLNGPTAVIFAESDAVTTAKALAEFIKDKDKSLPEIKLGLLDGQIPTEDDVVALVDDVLTTGGSMVHMKNAIKPTGARVIGGYVVAKRADARLDFPVRHILTAEELM